MTPARGWFYPGMAVATLATVFAGFAPTYYLRPSDAPPLPLLTPRPGRAPRFTGGSCCWRRSRFCLRRSAAPVHDLVRGRRPHPVSLWGGAAVFAYELGRFLVSETAAWRAIADWIV